MEEPEQTAALKALEELGMIDQQSKDSTEVNDLKAKIWEAELRNETLPPAYLIATN